MPVEYCRSDLFPGSVLEQNTADGSAVRISSDSDACACHKTWGQPKLGCLEMLVVFSWEEGKVVSQEKRNRKSHIYNPTSSLP